MDEKIGVKDPFGVPEVVEHTEKKILVECTHCGDRKYYRQKNKRPCPFRMAHRWIIRHGETLK